ncbi:hypothetical protein J2Z45_001699 [Cohnella lubricantis]|nr:hypothetical protein [Cohnella lubricantis]
MNKALIVPWCGALLRGLGREQGTYYALVRAAAWAGP